MDNYRCPESSKAILVCKINVPSFLKPGFFFFRQEAHGQFFSILSSQYSTVFPDRLKRAIPTPSRLCIGCNVDVRAIVILSNFEVIVDMRENSDFLTWLFIVSFSAIEIKGAQFTLSFESVQFLRALNKKKFKFSSSKFLADKKFEKFSCDLLQNFYNKPLNQLVFIRLYLFLRFLNK